MRKKEEIDDTTAQYFFICCFKKKIYSAEEGVLKLMEYLLEITSIFSILLSLPLLMWKQLECLEQKQLLVLFQMDCSLPMKRLCLPMRKQKKLTLPLMCWYSRRFVHKSNTKFYLCKIEEKLLTIQYWILTLLTVRYLHDKHTNNYVTYNTRASMLSFLLNFIYMIIIVILNPMM